MRTNTEIIHKGYEDRNKAIENERQLHLISARSAFLDDFHCRGRDKAEWCWDCADRWEDLQ